MKRFKNILQALAAIFIVASCAVENEQVTIEYNVSSAMTKSGLYGDVVNYVWYALYDMNGTLVTDFECAPIADGRANCPVTMVKGQSYNVIFVAQHYTPVGNALVPSYPIDDVNGKIRVPDTPVANTEEYDLFYGKDVVVNFSGVKPEPVTLNRIVAQVNFVTTSESWNAASELLPDASSIVLNDVAASYDLLSGELSSETTTLTFTPASLPAQDNVLGTSYCFPIEGISASLKLYKGGVQIGSMSVSNVAVETNRKTNITGNLLNN